jgi:hypothetical protein
MRPAMVESRHRPPARPQSEPSSTGTSATRAASGDRALWVAGSGTPCRRRTHSEPSFCRARVSSRCEAHPWRDLSSEDVPSWRDGECEGAHRDFPRAKLVINACEGVEVLRGSCPLDPPGSVAGTHPASSGTRLATYLARLWRRLRRVARWVALLVSATPASIAVSPGTAGDRGVRPLARSSCPRLRR